MCRLADDILMLARADHGRLPVRLRPVEPGGLLAAAAARARAAAALRGRPIVVGGAAAGCWLAGDPDRVAQALDNLISNALAYGRGTITLTAAGDGRLVGLHVADQGSGFGEDIAGRAFQRFTRGKRARDQGSGLGLSLVAAIAAAHRGTASVRNLPEGGADACIALPRWFPATLGGPQAARRGDGETIGAVGPQAAGHPHRRCRRAQPARSSGSRQRAASCRGAGREPATATGPANIRLPVRRVPR
jgi:signal transduction histidine kinase